MKPAISVAAVQTPYGVASVLQRLSAGERVAFFDRDIAGRQISTFSLQRVDQTYVVRDETGSAIASAPTFAEAWRRRPRSGEVAAR